MALRALFDGLTELPENTRGCSGALAESGRRQMTSSIRTLLSLKKTLVGRTANTLCRFVDVRLDAPSLHWRIAAHCDLY